jgi:hypothetical protein
VTGSPDAPPAPPPADGDGDGGLEAARRTAVVALVALVALVLAAAVAVVLRDSDDEPSPAVDGASGGAAAAPGDIGPRPGEPIADYVAARQQALAAVAEGDERVAVVSFTRYRTAAEADAVSTAAGVDRNIKLVARLVAAPGGDPAVVSGSLAGWATALRARAEEDRAQVEKILPTVEAGSEFIAFYQNELVRLAAVRDGADPDGSVVFGLVVRARGSTLRALAARPEVRLVDVGTTADTPSDARYSGLLPDDTDTTSNPSQRPIGTR